MLGEIKFVFFFCNVVAKKLIMLGTMYMNLNFNLVKIVGFKIKSL